MNFIEILEYKDQITFEDQTHKDSLELLQEVQHILECSLRPVSRGSAYTLQFKFKEGKKKPSSIHLQEKHCLALKNFLIANS